MIGAPAVIPNSPRVDSARRQSRLNPIRINTSMKSSFFIKSLIMSDLKSNRISTGDNKTFRISTSEKRSYKPFRINTSKNTPGEGGGMPLAGQAAQPAQPLFRPFSASRHGFSRAATGRGLRGFNP